MAELTRSEAIAEGLNINEIIRKATREAETKSKLAPIFLERKSFAATAVSISSLWLDWKMGGGIPPSRTIGIAGPERAGKSLLVTEILDNQCFEQRPGVYFDAEGGTDPIFLKVRGIDFNKYLGARNKKGDLKPGEQDMIFYYQPNTGNEVLHYISKVCGALPKNSNPLKPPMIFLLDSAVGLLPDDFDIDKGSMAMQARMYSDFMKVVRQAMNHSGCSFIYTNQIRQKPGVVYGSPDYEPCGNALQFDSSVRIRLSEAKPKLFDVEHPFVKKSDSTFIPKGEWKANRVWQEPHVDRDGVVHLDRLDRYMYTGLSTVKNRVYTPNQICWMRIQFEEDGATGKGLDPVFDIFSLLAESKYIVPASLTPEEKEAKLRVATVKGKYEAVTLNGFDPVAELGIPPRFDYYELKKWIYADDPKKLTRTIRDKMIVSGLVYS